MNITKKSENSSDWYNDVVLRAELADYSPVKGCMVIRPWGFGLWENVQKAFNPMMKKAGVQNAYFPIFIPMSFLQKEKEHVEGFSPELAVVTHAGGEELKEPLVIRPTSETIMYAQYAKWIQSWRDLPLKINQWNNVVRWEKRTYLFLRTTEFLWQEGHTAHATEEEMLAEQRRALNAYVSLYQDHYALFGYAGVKSTSERFAGARTTFTYEMLMPDGKVLQGCTSHDLGQNFSKVFDIHFLDNAGEPTFVWQTSWGLSTRSIGALILAHGDDNGLVLPPKLTPTHVVLVPIFANDEAKDKQIETEARKIADRLSESYEVTLDNRTEHSVGYKFNEWELKGVPIRIELGNKELEEERATVFRRDTKEKQHVKLADLSDHIAKLLTEIQQSLFEQSKTFTLENTHDVSSYDQFKEIMSTKRGFLRAFWCEKAECEEKIKAETKATTRCLPLDAKEESGSCIYCNKDATRRWLFAQAY